MSEQNPNVKVLGLWGSPFSKRVEIALKFKGIPYEYKEEEDVYTKKSEELLKCNPVYKKVPVLIHNGHSIVESLVILEYIDESWQGYNLLPNDPYEKSKARFWAKFIDEKCIPSLWKALWEPDDDQEKLKEAKENLRILEKELEGKKYFGGEKIGYVDIVANFISFWLGCIQESLGNAILTKENYPNLSKWAEDFVGYNIIKENLCPRERLLAFFASMPQKLQSK